MPSSTTDTLRCWIEMVEDDPSLYMVDLMERGMAGVLKEDTAQFRRTR